MSCAAPDSCVAVGRRISSSGTWVTLAEAWNGTSWKIQATPNPARSTSSEFGGVSCTAADSCTAVGFFDLPSGQTTTKTLAEAWDGTSWTIQATPNPKRSNTDELSAVSCTTSDSCTAVGLTYTSSSGSTVTLAEAWHGTSWTIQATTNPTGDTNGYLQAVSCTAGGACTAVGYSLTPQGAAATFAEAWNGTSWQTRDTPNPAGTTYAALSGVSCTAVDSCTAVGFSLTSSGQSVALAEAWDGTSWKIQVTPKATGTGLSAVSCTASGACTAIGAHASASGKTALLAEVWNGTSWKIQAIPSPTGISSSYLLGVSCSTGGACTAAGYEITSAGIMAPLAAARHVTSWKIQAIPSPTGEITSQLAGVSCAAADACAAVGSYYLNTSGLVVTLAEKWNGSAWSIQPTPNSPGTTGSGLSAVSCTAASACTAVGYRSTSSALVTLAEAWDGTSWKIQATPAPAGAEGSELSGVSCATSSACTAVGWYTNSAKDRVPLAEAWNGTAWKIQATPSLAGRDDSELWGVSCTAASACTATGFTGNYSGTEATLAETWNGASWKVQTTPDPVGATRGSYLQGVSCTAADACTATGYDVSSSDAAATLAEAWNGTSWKIQATPPGASRGELSGVSCTAAGACTATGFDVNSSGQTVTLAESWNGTSWKIQVTPNPAGAPVSELSGVSCTAAGICTAVGFHTKSTGIGATLGESQS